MSDSKNHPAINVIHALIRATHAIQREFETQFSALSVSVPFQISGARLRLLTAVSESGQIRMNELAMKLGVTARTVTDFVDALEQDKLLVRLPDPNDRRATLIRLTAFAQANLYDIHAVQTEVAENVLKNLSSEQRDQLLEQLDRLTENKDTTLSCEK